MSQDTHPDTTAARGRYYEALERQTINATPEALQAEINRLTDMHRKAVAEAVILLQEKTDRDEENARLRSELADVYESEHLLAAKVAHVEEQG